MLFVFVLLLIVIILNVWLVEDFNNWWSVFDLIDVLVVIKVSMVVIFGWIIFEFLVLLLIVMVLLLIFSDIVICFV